ncbi:MAG: double zinc ribbon domain-containing protein [Chromatiales bacterium]|nr:double zinc ribbon domain-containing protein [Chromatiales bacterium]
MKVYNCINKIQSILFPHYCLVCGETGVDGLALCQSCLDELPVNHHCCSLCALPLNDQETTLCGRCIKQAPHFDHCLAPYRFAPPLDELINGFKFSAKLSYGSLLSSLLMQALEKSQRPQPELIIPVPLHPRRLRQRGYNQALELAKPLGKQLGIPVNPRLCQRHRDTAAQSHLNRKERLKNLRGAFQLTGEITARRIAIVDDVVTTGSTVTEMARLFKQAGAEQVDIWSIARTPID